MKVSTREIAGEKKDRRSGSCPLERSNAARGRAKYRENTAAESLIIFRSSSSPSPNQRIKAKPRASRAASSLVSVSGRHRLPLLTLVCLFFLPSRKRADAVVPLLFFHYHHLFLFVVAPRNRGGNRLCHDFRGQGRERLSHREGCSWERKVLPGDHCDSFVTLISSCQWLHVPFVHRESKMANIVNFNFFHFISFYFVKVINKVIKIYI